MLGIILSSAKNSDDFCGENILAGDYIVNSQTCREGGRQNCINLSLIRYTFTILPGPSQARYIIVARVRPRTSKGTTDRLFPPIFFVVTKSPSKKLQ